MNGERQERKATVLHSQEAEDGAWSLLTRLDNKELRMDLRVNSYKPVTASIDEKDLMSYTKFLRSLKGFSLIKAMDEWDGEDAFPEFLMEEE